MISTTCWLAENSTQKKKKIWTLFFFCGKRVFSFCFVLIFVCLLTRTFWKLMKWKQNTWDIKKLGFSNEHTHRDESLSLFNDISLFFHELSFLFCDNCHNLSGKKNETKKCLVQFISVKDWKNNTVYAWSWKIKFL
jgi:hypothetical protein